MTICRRCKTTITDAKHYSSLCHDCSYIIQYENQHQNNQLGTTDLNPHPARTEREEYYEIQREYLRLGLQKTKLMKKNK